MSSITDKLSPKDKQILALFYETEAYTTVKKVFKLIKTNAGEQALKAQDFETVKWLQGQKYSIERLEDELEKVFKADQKR